MCTGGSCCDQGSSPLKSAHPGWMIPCSGRPVGPLLTQMSDSWAGGVTGAGNSGDPPFGTCLHGPARAPPPRLKRSRILHTHHRRHTRATNPLRIRVWRPAGRRATKSHQQSGLDRQPPPRPERGGGCGGPVRGQRGEGAGAYEWPARASVPAQGGTRRRPCRGPRGLALPSGK